MCVCVCVHVSGCGSMYMCVQEHVCMHEGKVVTKSTKLQPVLTVSLAVKTTPTQLWGE